MTSAPGSLHPHSFQDYSLAMARAESAGLRSEREAGKESRRLRKLRTALDKDGWTHPFAGDGNPIEWWAFNDALSTSPMDHLPCGWVRKLKEDREFTAGVYLRDPHARIMGFDTLAEAKAWVMGLCVEQALL